MIQLPGTALGELPPYFMARAARLSGTHPDDDEFKEFEELQEMQKCPDKHLVRNILFLLYLLLL
jgi:hypothetical protein